MKIPCSGPKFTWCNKRSWPARVLERLDRALVSIDFLNNFPNFSSFHLPKRTLIISRFLFMSLLWEIIMFNGVLFSIITCGSPIRLLKRWYAWLGATRLELWRINLCRLAVDYLYKGLEFF